jgi:hypothetical protein
MVVVVDDAHVFLTMAVMKMQTNNTARRHRQCERMRQI